MGLILFLVGIAFAGYAGYEGLDWYFIFISSLIMAFGYFLIRAPQINEIISNNGAGVLPKLLFLQVMGYSMITAPVYFILSAFN